MVAPVYKYSEIPAWICKSYETVIASIVFGHEWAKIVQNTGRNSTPRHGTSSYGNSRGWFPSVLHDAQDAFSTLASPFRSSILQTFFMVVSRIASSISYLA